MTMKKTGSVSEQKSVMTLPDELVSELLTTLRCQGGSRRQSLGGANHHWNFANSNSTMMILPDDLVFDILDRLRGKQLIQCKSVCKDWLSIIRRPRFLKSSRNHQPNLKLFVGRPATATGAKVSCLSSTLFRLRKESTEEEFGYLCELRTNLPGVKDRRLTQMVNGLVCFSVESKLNVYNVFTGQGMRLPDPAPYTSYPRMCFQAFHLGYVPATRKYKLLRFIELEGCSFQMQVEIMTLMPNSSSSSSTWRKLKLDRDAIFFYLSIPSVLTGDGVLWFFIRDEGKVVSFDFNKEKFKVINLPENVLDYIKVNYAILIQSMERPAIWINPAVSYDTRFKIFVLENEESNLWNKYFVPLPKELEFVQFNVAAGCLPTGEILLMNSVHKEREILLTDKVQKNQEHRRPIYSYNHHTSKFDRFLVRELQDNANVGVRGASITCLHDNGSLYLPLKDVLGS